jgi:hypothetical protein
MENEDTTILEGVFGELSDGTLFVKLMTAKQ